MIRPPYRYAAALLTFALLGAAACSDDDMTTNPGTTVLGSTPGYLNGSVVTFDYTQNFECKNPPASGASSGCVVGQAPQTRPAGTAAATTPILYVLTPLFSPAPAAETLHCPTAGNCVTHPTTIDVSAALGPGTANIPLPPHSHVIAAAQTTPTAFELKVIGFTDAATWNQMAQGKSLTTLRALQAADPQGAKLTGDLPTNTFLFFRTRQ